MKEALQSGYHCENIKAVKSLVLYRRVNGKRWRQHVQSPQIEAELEALRRSVVRGAPFGKASWQNQTAKRLGQQSTLRPRGRPWKSPTADN